MQKKKKKRVRTIDEMIEETEARLVDLKARKAKQEAKKKEKDAAEKAAKDPEVKSKLTEIRNLRKSKTILAKQGFGDSDTVVQIEMKIQGILDSLPAGVGRD